MLRSKNIRNLLINSLHEFEALELLKMLNLNLSKEQEPYKLLLETNFSRNSKREKTLFDFFEESIPSTEGDIVESKRGDSEFVNVERRLFPHQRVAITEINGYLSSGKRKCLLHMPTGSGKTVTAMRAITTLFLNSSPTMVIWLAYNEELCEQAIEEFQKMWASVGDRNIKLFRYFGSQSPNIISETRKCKESIIFASLAKLNLAEQKGNAFLSTLSDRVDLVIMDEAHQAMAPTYMNILQQLVEKRIGTKLLGLSATPGRASLNVQESVSLAKFFNHKKVTIKIDGYDNPLKYLIDKGYLAKPNAILIRADGNLSSEDINRIVTSPIDIPEDILIKMGKNSKRTIKVVNEIVKLINSEHKRIIVFGASVENSRDLNMILVVLGHKSFHVDQKTHPETRQRIVTEYKRINNETIIMCNYGVFTAGFDAPQTSAVVIARPTKSIILYSQMAGRGMRGENVGGNRNCEIRTITDIKLPQFTKLVESFFTWEEIW